MAGEDDQWICPKCRGENPLSKISSLNKCRWCVINPDNAVDLLPQPYRMITEVLEDEILLKVERKIKNINDQRRAEEYEHGLDMATPTGSLLVPGRITAVPAEPQPRGTSRFALGTSHGEVWLVDSVSQSVIARKGCFAEDEAVHRIALASDSAYAPRPAALGEEPPLMQRPRLKVLASGVRTPRVLVFDACKETYGVSLKPACAIHVQMPPEREADESEAGVPWIADLHAKGASNGVWVLTLQADRSINVYLCPLGAPSDTAQVDKDKTAVNAIAEEEEEEENPGQNEDSDEFAKATKIETALYSFSLASLAPLRGMPEPSLDQVLLTVFVPCAERRSIAHGSAARQVPLICAASSSKSNVVLGYSFQLPEPFPAPQGLSTEELMLRILPPSGELPQPSEPQTMAPRRRWELPAATTAVAASPCGSLFAVGGAKGAIALIDTGPGLSLRTMLRGHYSSVTGVCFHRAEILVSVGADGWVHHYSVHGHTVLARYMSAPPLHTQPGPVEEDIDSLLPESKTKKGTALPKSVVVQGVAASQQLAVGLSLDAEAGLRVHDLRRGRKVAFATCHELDPSMPAGADGEVVEGIEELPRVDERPRLIWASSSGFCVMCQADPPPAPEPPVDADGEAAADDAAEGEEEGQSPEVSQEERSFLVMFDYAKMASKIYPGLIPKAKGRPRGLADAFNTMPVEELMKEQAPSTVGSKSELDAFSDRRTTQGTAQGKPSLRKSVENEKEVCKLTAENLRMMGKPGDGGDTLLPSLTALPAKSRSPHQLSHNWQVSSRRHLRSSLAEKEGRRQRIDARLKQLQKDLGEG